MPHPTYTHVVSVYRLTRSGNKDAYGAAPVILDLDVSVIPAGPETQAIYGGLNAFALYEIYTAEKVTLQSGDKLVSGDHAWIVQGQPQTIENRHQRYVRVLGLEAV